MKIELLKEFKLGDRLTTPVVIIYDVYLKYCDIHNMKPISLYLFTKELKNYCRISKNLAKCNLLIPTQLLTDLNITFTYFKSFVYETTKAKSPSKKRNRRLDDELYKQFRLDVLKRDNYKCRRCSTSRKLNVHHMVNYSSNETLRCNPDFAAVLCTKCHRLFHSKEYYGNRNNSPEQFYDFISNQFKLSRQIPSRL